MTPPAAPNTLTGDQPPVPVIDAGYGAAGPDDDTAPIPVILHGGHTDSSEPAGGPQSSATVGMRLRGPFEPPLRAEAAAGGGPGSGFASRAAQPGNGLAGGLSAVASSAPPGSEGVSPAASATLEQIKDLYLTAEAIGEVALDKHFHQVSERQRQLIREYFDRAVAGPIAGQDPAGRSS